SQLQSYLLINYVSPPSFCEPSIQLTDHCRVASAPQGRCMGLSKGVIRSLHKGMVCVALALSGCSVTPPKPPEVPFELPDAFLATPTAAYAAADRWWLDFNDERL